MHRDLFAEAGITPNDPRDLFGGTVTQEQPEQGMKGSVMQNISGALVEPAMQMGSGYLASVPANIGGMAAAAKDYLTGNPDGDPQGFKNYLQEKFTYQPRTSAGQAVSENILAPIGSAIESGAGAIAEPLSMGSDVAKSGIKETLLQGVGLAGVKGSPKAISAVEKANMSKLASLKAKYMEERIANNVRREGNKIGLVAPASGTIKNTFENIGGAEPHLSLQNRTRGTEAVAKDVGLGKGAISEADLNTRTTELAKDYKTVQSALGSNVNMNTNFYKEVSDLLKPLKDSFVQDPVAFKGYQGAIDLLEGQLTQKTIEPSILMNKIRQFRKDARTLSKDTSGDPIKIELADASFKLANIYENLVESSLGNKTALLDRFRNSRKQLSKIHMIEQALSPTDGLLDLPKLSTVVGKYSANRKMVDGNLKTVADFANQFKNVTKNVTKEQMSTASRWELMAGGLGGSAAIGAAGATGNPAALLMAAPLAARALAPSIAKKGMLQSPIPSYELSLPRKALPFGVGSTLLEGAFSPYAQEQQ